MDRYSDEDLMILVSKDKLDCLSELFKKYHKRLFNFFLKLTFNKELSHDFTQDVFYRILKYRKSYKSKHLFKTWMYQIARNILIKHYNKKTSTVSTIDFSEKYQEIYCNEKEKLNIDNECKILYKALDMLSLEQKELILLNRFEGLKFKEIAKINGQSEGAVKVKTHRAINKLREIYININNK